MGQKVSKLSQILKAVSEDNAEVTLVDLSGLNLQEKGVRHLCDALRVNR